MKKIFSHLVLIFMLANASCNHPETNKVNSEPAPDFTLGEFGYDLKFLQKQDSNLVILKDGNAQVIVSPKYQAKVFTSTAQGENGISFGWINYKAFGKVDAHMNAYGGENRFWLGPEGGKFSLFFPPDSAMIFANWKTPAAIDTESWNVKSQDSNSVTMHKEMSLINYAGTRLLLTAERMIMILGKEDILKKTGMQENDSVHMVGYMTKNQITNNGDQEWTETTGMPCIWILDMFKPSPDTRIVVPFRKTAIEDFSKVATTNYFGEIPSDRIRHTDHLLVFKADGKSRGKLGIQSGKAGNIAGSYDAENKVLTVILFDVDDQARYLNQEWNTSKPSFSGDAVNAYNDGPLADGSQMGPFYEIESVSPAAFLKPTETLSHTQYVLHFSGEEKSMDGLSLKMLGISLEDLKKTFSNEKTN